MKRLCLLLVITFFFGCTPKQYLVQYDSIPRGALVVCEGHQQGYTPVLKEYPKAKLKSVADGGIVVIDCTYKWISGAEKHDPLVIDFNKYPDGVKITVHRPEHPDYQKDAEIALRLNQEAEKRMYEEQKNQVSPIAGALEAIAEGMEEERNRQSSGFTCWDYGDWMSCK